MFQFSCRFALFICGAFFETQCNANKLYATAKAHVI